MAALPLNALEISETAMVSFERFTFGKLVSKAPGAAPDKLGITSRSSGLDVEDVDALGLDALLNENPFSNALIDPACVTNGILIVRTMERPANRGQMTVVSRARLRENVDSQGNVRSHPQLTGWVLKLDDWVECSTDTLTRASYFRAEPDSMETPYAERYGELRPPIELRRNFTTRPSFSTLDSNALAILHMLVSRTLRTSQDPSASVTFGKNHFSNELAFLTTVARALAHLPTTQRDIWSQITITCGLRIVLPGFCIRWLPSEQGVQHVLPERREILQALQLIEFGQSASHSPQASEGKFGGVDSHAGPDAERPVRTTRLFSDNSRYPDELFNCIDKYQAANSGILRTPDSAWQSVVGSEPFDSERMEDSRKAALRIHEMFRPNLDLASRKHVAELDIRFQNALASLHLILSPPQASFAIGTLFDGAFFHSRLAKSQNAVSAVGELWRDFLASALARQSMLLPAELAYLESSGVLDADKINQGTFSRIGVAAAVGEAFDQWIRSSLSQLALGLRPPQASDKTMAARPRLMHICDQGALAPNSSGIRNQGLVGSIAVDFDGILTARDIQKFWSDALKSFVATSI